MATFGESAPGGRALARPPQPAAPALPGAGELLAANLYGVCELVAARAARPSTRRQYGAIYRRFCDAVRSELGRPPEVGDLSADAIAAYARALERDGGRGGRPMALATRRVHLTMLRALAAELGLEAVADEVRPPSHRVGPRSVDASLRNSLHPRRRRTAPAAHAARADGACRFAQSWRLALLTPLAVAVGVEAVGIASADADRPADVRAVEVGRRWGKTPRGGGTVTTLRPPRRPR